MCFKITINTSNYCRGMNSMSSCFFAKLGINEKKSSEAESQIQNARYHSEPMHELYFENN